MINDHLNYIPKNILKGPLKRLFEPEFELTFEPEFELTLILNPLPLFHSLTKIINLEIDIQKQNDETY